MLLQAEQIIFDIGILNYVEAGKRRQRFHGKELKILVQPHENAVNSFALKELILIFKGFERGIPGGGQVLSSFPTLPALGKGFEV